MIHNFLSKNVQNSLFSFGLCFLFRGIYRGKYCELFKKGDRRMENSSKVNAITSDNAAKIVAAIREREREIKDVLHI